MRITHEDRIVELPIDSIDESPFNTRQLYLDMQGLADNIKAEGRVHEPLLVRPAGDRHELVFGHRRRRGAAMAGLATVPCMVRAMTDAEVRSAQVAENLQRTDVHPLEEAQAFQQMIDAGDATADELAARFGRSRSYVYARLQLLRACPELRKAMLEGRIKSEVALLVVRVGDEALQAKALAAIARTYHASLDDGGAASYRVVKDLLTERFTLELKHALFDPADATLVAEAGTCTACPKRSGNSPVYADVVNDKPLPYRPRPAGPNVCTDPDCFAAKKAAHLARQADALRAKGKAVVAGGAARQAIGADGTVRGKYVELTPAVRDALKKAAASKPLPEAVHAVAIQNPRDGKVKTAVAVADLQAAGVKVDDGKKKAARADHQWERQRERDQAKLEAHNESRRALVRRIHHAATAAPRSVFDLRTVAAFLLDRVNHDELLLLLHQLWGMAEGGGTLEDRTASMSEAELQLLLLECVVVGTRGLFAHWVGATRDGVPQRVQSVAQHYGVPLVEPAPEGSEGASTPSPAARAPAGASKGKARAKKPSVSLGALVRADGEKQTDDAAGVAGVERAEAAVLEEAAP